MRRIRHSRTSGREHATEELFSTRGLEGEPVARGTDQDFPLRPFAAAVMRDPIVSTEPVATADEAERLALRAREEASRGRHADAITSYRDLLMIAPGFPGAHRALAALLEAEDDLEGALEEYTAALSQAADPVDILLARGAVLIALKQYPEAEADLRRALKAAPNHPGVIYQVGLVTWRRGLPTEAAQFLQRAVQAEPGNAAAWYYLGEALNQLTDFRGAEHALRHAAELDPAHAKTFQLLGRILDRLNRPDEAREMYRRGREVPGR